MNLVLAFSSGPRRLQMNQKPEIQSLTDCAFHTHVYGDRSNYLNQLLAEWEEDKRHEDRDRLHQGMREPSRRKRLSLFGLAPLLCTCTGVPRGIHAPWRRGRSLRRVEQWTSADNHLTQWIHLWCAERTDDCQKRGDGNRSVSISSRTYPPGQVEVRN